MYKGGKLLNTQGKYLLIFSFIYNMLKSVNESLKDHPSSIYKIKPPTMVMVKILQYLPGILLRALSKVSNYLYP